MVMIKYIILLIILSFPHISNATYSCFSYTGNINNYTKINSAGTNMCTQYSFNATTGLLACTGTLTTYNPYYLPISPSIMTYGWDGSRWVGLQNLGFAYSDVTKPQLQAILSTFMFSPNSPSYDFPSGCVAVNPCPPILNAATSSCGGAANVDALFVPGVHADVDPNNTNGCRDIDYKCTSCPSGSGVANAGVPVVYTGIKELGLALVCGGFPKIASYDKSSCSGSCQPVTCDQQIQDLKKKCGLSSAGATNSDPPVVWGFTSYDLTNCTGTCPDKCFSAKKQAASKCPNRSYTMAADCSYTCNNCTDAIAACVSKCGILGVETNTCSGTDSKCVCKNSPISNISIGNVNGTNTITNPDGTKTKTDISKNTDANGNVTKTTTTTTYDSSGVQTGTSTTTQTGDINGTGSSATGSSTTTDQTPPNEYSSDGSEIDFSGWYEIPNLVNSKMPTKYTSQILSIASSFSSSSTAPVFTLTMMGHSFNVDLSIFDPVAVVIRIMITLFFNVAIGLALIRLWSRWS